jgi:aryl-phospho-beta-D-glucosidase BglC (GH1 family)
MPVYPETCFNGGSPYYSPEPYPVGTPAPATHTVTLLSATDYINNVLKPAVDYATSKNLYVIIDFHQIDNVTSGTNNSSAAAVTFWTTVAPVFSSYSNVIYEAFNEPIDSKTGWNAAFQTAAQSWVTAIRSGAPNNLIVVGSPSWSQHPEGALTLPLTGGNLVFTAHIYPGNYPGSMNAFQNNVTTAIAQVPVFITEWGYQIGTTSPTNNLATPNDTWAQNLQTFVNGNGASWTAWVADPSWGPPMFQKTTGLTDFGTFVQNWLANP